MDEIERLDESASDGWVVELFHFLREERAWWLGPFVGVLGALSFVIGAAEASALSPFLYVFF